MKINFDDIFGKIEKQTQYCKELIEKGCFEDAMDEAHYLAEMFHDVETMLEDLKEFKKKIECFYNCY